MILWFYILPDPCDKFENNNSSQFKCLVNGAFMEPFSASLKLVQTIKDWNIPAEIFLLELHMKLIEFLNCVTNSLSQLAAGKPKILKSGGWLRMAVSFLHILYICLGFFWSHKAAEQLVAILWAIQSYLNIYLLCVTSWQLIHLLGDRIKAE